MKFGLQCYDCVVKQFTNIIDNQKMDESKKELLLKESIHILLNSDTNEPAPIVVKDIYNRLHKAIGNSDPYEEIKKMSNDFALGILDSLKKFIYNSEDKIISGLKLSITGNIIDYGAPGGKGVEEIDDFLLDTSQFQFDKKTIEVFKNDINNAEKILFIGDNAGEIVFDKLFIEQLPTSKITYCVRGYPIINDITMEDAQYIGLDEIVEVISTGDNTPGIDFNHVSSEFIEKFNSSDVVILKGQGNFETLIDKDISKYIDNKIPLYFLFKVKCGYVSQQIQKEQGSVELIRKY